LSINFSYDGFDVGTFQEDALQFFYTLFHYINTSGAYGNGQNGQLLVPTQGGNYIDSLDCKVLVIDPTVRFGPVTKPPSWSTGIFIVF